MDFSYSYDYESIYKTFADLEGLDKDDLTYLDSAISLLYKESPKLAAYTGMLQGRCIVLESAKGRASLNITQEQLEHTFSEYKKASNTLDGIKEVIMLTKMKVKILKENNVY